MAKLIIVIGLPGSGKTNYLTKLKKQKEIVTFYDDYQGKSYNKSADPKRSRCFHYLIKRLKKGQTVAVSDIRYCRQSELDNFVTPIVQQLPKLDIELRYFENNPEACINNIKRERSLERINRELKLISELSPEYKTVGNTIDVYVQ